MATNALLRFAWYGYWALWFAATHVPKLGPSKPWIPHLDKAVHFIGYAALASLTAAVAMRQRRPLPARWFVTWTVALAAYAAFDELTQPYVNRSADLADWLADVLGLATAFAIVQVRFNRGRL